MALDEGDRPAAALALAACDRDDVTKIRNEMAGMRKAKVALARELAVVLHRMLADETEFLVAKQQLLRYSKRRHHRFARGRHHPPGAGPVAGTMDEARPENGQ